jgi:hypothetical protein
MGRSFNRFTPTTRRPNLSFWQIRNMSFGFSGIRSGWGLQLGDMSAICENVNAVV